MSSDSDIEILDEIPSTSNSSTNKACIPSVQKIRAPKGTPSSIALYHLYKLSQSNITKSLSRTSLPNDPYSIPLSKEKPQVLEPMPLPPGILQSKNDEDHCYCTICNSEMSVVSVKSHLKTLTHQINLKKKADVEKEERVQADDKEKEMDDAQEKDTSELEPKTTKETEANFSSLTDPASVEIDPDFLKVLSSPTRKKKPFNAYMMWSFLERQKIVKDCPDWPTSTLHKILGSRWKKMTDEEKKPFVDEAKKLKESFEKNHQYRPIVKRKRKHYGVLIPVFPKMPQPVGNSQQRASIPHMNPPVIPNFSQAQQTQKSNSSSSTNMASSSTQRPINKNIFSRNTQTSIINSNNINVSSKIRSLFASRTQAYQSQALKNPNMSSGLVEITSAPWNPRKNPLYRREVKEEDCITLE